MKLMVGDNVIIATDYLHGPLQGETGTVLDVGLELPSGERAIRLQYTGRFNGLEGDVAASALVLCPPECDCRAAELHAPVHSASCHLQVWLNKHK